MQQSQYRVPAYVDVSHSRAPYRNVWSMGANEAPPTPGPTGPLEPGGNGGGDMTAFLSMMTNDDGVWRFKPETANTIMAYLLTYRIIQIPGAVPERVAITPYTAEEIAAMKTPEGQAVFAPLQAAKWVADKVKEGKAVFAPPFILAPEGSVAQKELAAIPASDKDAVRTAASTPYAGILAEPGGWFGGISAANIGIAVAALAVVGGGYWLYQRNKHGGQVAY